jgi:hypothetical protein
MIFHSAAGPQVANQARSLPELHHVGFENCVYVSLLHVFIVVHAVSTTAAQVAP